MIHKIDIETFLDKKDHYPVVDVRTPSEFVKGHIPGAYNIPLFSDDERAEIGTLYKKAGRDAAIMRALEITGPKIADYVKQAKELKSDGHLLVHCWRGGMRSESMAWLFITSGLRPLTLTGGYKSYRRHIGKAFETQAKLIVLGGMTGTGKTELLHEIEKLGHQALHLEDIANHKGSAFGGIGQHPQPSSEQFTNDLFEKWRHINFDRPVWIEDESYMIGSVTIPEPLFVRMRSSVVIKIEVDIETRIQRLVDEYACFQKEHLTASVERIRKRLGGLNTDLCLKALDEKDFHTVAKYTLKYYDKAYEFGLSKRNNQLVKNIYINMPSPAENAKLILKFAEDIFQNA
ncbi:MAG: tRNA 2-selenouridine(34) synthase MnmH [Bacteroidetes bacterium]|nr:tRNA 2-selenouridine(34) synthase MnmH [Bacteroidota bacterium]